MSDFDIYKISTNAAKIAAPVYNSGNLFDLHEVMRPKRKRLDVGEAIKEMNKTNHAKDATQERGRYFDVISQEMQPKKKVDIINVFA